MIHASSSPRRRTSAGASPASCVAFAPPHAPPSPRTTPPGGRLGTRTARRSRAPSFDESSHAEARRRRRARDARLGRDGHVAHLPGASQPRSRRSSSPPTGCWSERPAGSTRGSSPPARGTRPRSGFFAARRRAGRSTATACSGRSRSRSRAVEPCHVRPDVKPPYRRGLPRLGTRAHGSSVSSATALDDTARGRRGPRRLAVVGRRPSSLTPRAWPSASRSRRTSSCRTAVARGRRWPEAVATVEDRERLVEKTRSSADGGLVRVHLRLRSPKESSGGSRPATAATTRRARRSAIRRPARLRPPRARARQARREDDRRLETVEGPDGSANPVPAKPLASPRYLGAFVASWNARSRARWPLSTPLRSLRDTMLLVARLKFRGRRGARAGLHARPHLDAPAELAPPAHPVGPARSTTTSSSTARRRASSRSRSSAASPSASAGGARTTRCCCPSSTRPRSSPTSKPQRPCQRPRRRGTRGPPRLARRRDAELDRELAHVNNVTHLTRDEYALGALVSLVYPGSPTQKAASSPARVLLRIHSPQRPKPIDVSSGEDGSSGSAHMFESIGEDAMEQFKSFMPATTPCPAPRAELDRHAHRPRHQDDVVRP